MVEPPQPSEELKPWYYQEWFMFPTAVFWPLWAILIIRSPWHNGLVSGAVAWAMLFVGGYLIIWAQLIQSGRLNPFTISLILPGLILTVITQVHWVRYRPVLRAGLLSDHSATDSAAGGASPEIGDGARSPRRRRRRSRAGHSGKGRD